MGELEKGGQKAQTYSYKASQSQGCNAQCGDRWSHYRVYLKAVKRVDPNITMKKFSFLENDLPQNFLW